MEKIKNWFWFSRYIYSSRICNFVLSFNAYSLRSYLESIDFCRSSDTLFKTIIVYKNSHEFTDFTPYLVDFILQNNSWCKLSKVISLSQFPLPHN